MLLIFSKAPTGLSTPLHMCLHILLLFFFSVTKPHWIGLDWTSKPGVMTVEQSAEEAR